jgi:hypothetical protein
MTLGIPDFSSDNLGRRILRWMNLRPGELGRTSWMFAFYVFTSIGILWFEATSSGLFLQYFGSNYLPYIYLASMVISSAWSAIYTWLQRFIPLRWVVVLVAVCIALPIPLFLSAVDDSWNVSQKTGVFGFTVLQVGVLGMRLWLQSVYVLNDLNTTITANQLFNVREIRRTYPLISSGVLVADVVAGLALPLLLSWLGLSMVVMSAFLMIVLGAAILFFLGRSYERYFPQSTIRRRESRGENTTTSKVSGELSRYRNLLFVFFILAEVVFLLVDFQFMSQLEVPKLLGLVMGNPANRSQDELIAGFIGKFQGILGFFELALQWVFSSRLIERFGIFPTASVLPITVLVVGSLGAVSALLPKVLYGSIDPVLPLIAGQAEMQFFLMIGLKFLYELFHFTLLASIGPVLFQPLPDSLRNSIQSVVRGTAEPIATGVVGVVLAIVVAVGVDRHLGQQWQTTLFIVSALLSGAWLATNFWIRGNYLRLWVIKSARTNFRNSNLLLKEFKKDAVDAISKLKSDEDMGSCIELLSRIDPKDMGAVLVPLLPKLKPKLQQRVIEVMLHAGNPDPSHLMVVHQVLARAVSPELTAAALKYVYLMDDNANFTQLQPYLAPNIPPVIRGAAAVLCLDKGNTQLKGEATNVLRLMLTNPHKAEKLMGCNALNGLKFLQALQLYIPGLLKEDDLDVRRAVLEVIATTRFEKSYPALIQGLYEHKTRATATTALINLGDEGLASLKRIADDWRQPDVVRSAVWYVLGQIASGDALDALISRMSTVWGDDRRGILRALVKMPDDRGIETTLDKLGRPGIETLIDQELMLMGQTTAGLMDLSSSKESLSEAGAMLQRSLQSVQSDSIERLFLLMQFLYDPYTIQAAAFNLQSGNLLTMAQGLEILDNQLDIPNKRAVLALLDRNPELDKKVKALQDELQVARSLGNAATSKQLRAALEKLVRQQRADLEKQMQALTKANILTYEPMPAQQRLCELMNLRHFFSDWVIACCFYLAREARWSLTRQHVLSGIRNAKGFVREATLLYLHDVYPQAFDNVLPKLRNDPDRLVRTQVREIMSQWRNQLIPFPESDDDDMNTAALGPMN